ncbi:MAG TPA: allantoinase AllB [Pseudonocardiaceae bacterium]|nr:allantoinase AllB [Pseudonocardiaceae bacterium]
MTDVDIIFRAARTVTPDGEAPRTVAVRNGSIVELAPLDASFDAAREVVLGADEVLLAGVVDTHVHVNEPGRTAWEGFATATRAAAAGGVTTLVDMPLNSIPPTCDLAALELKRRTADGLCHVDVGFWGGAIPRSLGSLRELHEAGVFGFKCFLVDSGVDEFPALDYQQLDRAMREISEFDGVLIVHAEDADTIDNATPPHGRAYDDFLRSRPDTAEVTAIERLIDVSRRTGCRVHVLHLSSALALDALAGARADGVRVSVETCPHYLSFAAGEIPTGATQFKCCPPIRGGDNRDALWAGLAAGTIDVVVSDHSPCTLDLKQLEIGDFAAAWGGISSLQLGLSAIWSQARARGLSLSDVTRWMSARPAELFGLPGKGRIAVGHAADLCVFAPEETFTVHAAALHHRNPVTAYEGRELHGVVRSTWLAGEQIAAGSALVGSAPRGQLLRADVEADVEQVFD